MTSNNSMTWPLAALVALGLNLIPLAYAQDPSCAKECGFGGSPAIAHRSCTGVGATNCHVSGCQDYANSDCQAPVDFGKFNDVCTSFGADDPNDAEAHDCFE